jgi:hypothetical protein
LRSGLQVALLLACIAAAYAAILFEGSNARANVVDSTALGATLASTGTGAINTAFDEASASASIGINYRFPAAVRWTISPLPGDSRGRHWLYIAADEPQFFATDGAVTVAVDSKSVGTIRARPGATPESFVADPRRATIRIPPAESFGYRFELPDSNICVTAACVVSVQGKETFWHAFRLAVIAERPRYLAEATR